MTASAAGYSPKQWGTLQRYVRGCADLFGLRDWEIVVDKRDLENDDADAECHISENQREAGIRFAWDFPDLKPDRQRYVIVHELVHCHVEVPWQNANHVIEVAMGMEAGHVAKNTFGDLMELAVDCIARAIAHHFPMPPAELSR